MFRKKKQWFENTKFLSVFYFFSPKLTCEISKRLLIYQILKLYCFFFLLNTSRNIIILLILKRPRDTRLKKRARLHTHGSSIPQYTNTLFRFSFSHLIHLIYGFYCQKMIVWKTVEHEIFGIILVAIQQN